MPRPAVPRDEIQRVKTLWLEGGKPTAEKLLEKDLLPTGDQRHGIRKYQQWIAEARRDMKDIQEDSKVVPWGDGWPCDPHAAEEVDCLFRMYRAALEYPLFPLTERVAKWGQTLRKVFSGQGMDSNLDLDLELLHFAYRYALRERACAALSQSPSYADLDAMVTYRIWESPERFQQYQGAITAGNVPPNDPATILKNEAAIHGWEDILSGFVNQVFWFFSRVQGFRLSDDEESGEEKILKSGVEAINTLHLVSGEPEAMVAVRQRIKLFQEDLEGEVKNAIEEELAEYFKSWLAWWTKATPGLISSVEEGITEDQILAIEREGADARICAVAEQG